MTARTRGGGTALQERGVDPEEGGHADSAFRAQAERILRRSDPIVVGRHEWRITLYIHRHRPRVPMIGYEWRRADRRDHRVKTPHGDYTLPGDRWRRDVDWPRYDADNGQTAGLPKTVFKLWECNPWARTRNLVRVGDDWIDPAGREA